MVSFAPKSTTVVVVSLSSFNAFCCTQSRPLFCRRERAPQHIERETQNGDLFFYKEKRPKKRGEKSNSNPKHIILKSISCFPLSSFIFVDLFFLIFFLSSSSPLSSPSFVTYGLSRVGDTRNKKKRRKLVSIFFLFFDTFRQQRAFYTLWGE